MASNPFDKTLGEVKVSLSEFEWVIPNFISLSEESCISPSFSFAGASWHLCIRPNGVSGISEGYVTICIFRWKNDLPITLKVSFAIKTLDGKRDQERNDTEHISTSEFEGYRSCHCISRDELLKRASELLPANVLTVLCSVKHLQAAEDASDNETVECSYCEEIVDAEDIYFHEKKCVEKPIKCPECTEVVALRNWYEHECKLSRTKGEHCTSALSVVLPEKKLLVDLKDLFLNKEDCDVVLKVKGEEFLAHKNILKARSSVFKSTFRTDMKEKATGVVEIEDCDPSCFSNFLCFLYCGDEGEISKENVFSLFTVADKYDVQDLREKCMTLMKENLSVDTFCDTINLALRHSETELIKLSTEFFTKNAPKIIVTAKWQVFSAENPTKSNELFIKLLVPDASVSE